MRRMFGTAALLAAMTLAVPASAQAPQGQGDGSYGCPMMGGGPGWGMGPGMMGGWGPGWRGGWGGGPGWGMGPGMMGGGPGWGMGPGMMGGGPGWGGPMMGGGGPGWGGGPGMWAGPATTESVTQHVQRHLQMMGNDRLKLGKVSEQGDSIVAEIVTQDGSLVDRLAFDKQTGRPQRVQ